MLCYGNRIPASCERLLMEGSSCYGRKCLRWEVQIDLRAGPYTFGVVCNNDLRVGYCWFLGARAHHLRGPLGYLVSWWGGWRLF